jgi:hypothetical protein
VVEGELPFARSGYFGCQFRHSLRKQRVIEASAAVVVELQTALLAWAAQSLPVTVLEPIPAAVQEVAEEVEAWMFSF